MSNIGTLLILIITMFIVVIFWAATNIDKSGAVKILYENGYKSIQITGYKWFACAHDDWSHTGFTAINQQNNKINGVVCCGLFFKNCTIRYK